METKNKTCYKCNLFSECGDVNRTLPCSKKETFFPIESCKEFYRDLCGTVYGNANITSGGIMSASKIAEVMSIPEKETENWMNSLIHYNITERQGGMYVI